MTEPQNKLEDLQKAASAELSSMGRVSHRLAMTEGGAPLEKVLALLLPRLLNRIGINHKRTLELKCDHPNKSSIKATYDGIHGKVVEMLSHIMKRVRADNQCKLPCEAVLALMYNSKTHTAFPPTDINPFTLNLSLTFLTIGIPRSSSQELLIMLPGLLSLLGAHSGVSSLRSKSRKNQAFQVGHLLLRTIESIVRNTPNLRLGLNHKSKSIPNSNKTEETPSISELIKSARKLCRTNIQVGAALYELLLDILLYQTMPLNTDLPPPGLSQIGKERLLSGTSTVAKTWAAEYASYGRLRELKLAVLDFISPCRTWDIFGCSSTIKGFQEYLAEGSTNETFNERNEISDDEFSISLGVTRTVSLLVASSGDKNDDIADRASSFLKAHLDSLKNTRSSSERNNIKGEMKDSSAISPSLLGEPISLSCQLLTLVVGDLVSDNIILKANLAKSKISTNFGVHIEKASNIDRTMILSLKRRVVSEKTATIILNFISLRVLEEIPGIFSSLLEKKSETTTDYFERCGGASSLIGNLALLAVKKYVGSGRSLSGTSITSSSGNPSIAAARLLNSLCIRLVSLFDSISTFLGESDDDASGIGRKICGNLHETLIRSLNIACSIVSVAASAHSGDVKNPIGIETRDAGYGLICTIFRSKLVMAKGHTVFTCGGNSSSYKPSISTSQISSNIASSLFGCCSNETESLKPRAVAALDSTLAAYCRLYENNKTKLSVQHTTTPIPYNPWADGSNHVVEELKKSTESTVGTIFEGFSLCILPLLWNAAQSFQPKASRHASAKWANELLKPLDLVNACHILCFLTGDKDTTISSMSKDGLGISFQTGKDEISSVAENGKEIKLPDFNAFVETVFSKSGDINHLPYQKQTYVCFSPMGQGATLRFGMMCLLSDLYGNEKMLLQFLSFLSNTLLTFRVRSGSTGSRQDKESMDLLDECSICLAECLRTSQFAREKFAGSFLPLTHEQIADLVMTSTSSKARRHLAAGCGSLFEDLSIWNCKCPDGSAGVEEWIKNSSMNSIMKLCASKLVSMQKDLFMVGEVHGAIYLGSRCVRAFRTLLYLESHKILTPTTKDCWEFASSILSSLGRGLDSEEVIGNASSKGLTIALSYDGLDCIPLDEKLHQGTAQALVQLASSIRKYGNGDHADATRAYSLAEAAGIVLASSTLHLNNNKSFSDTNTSTQNPINIGSSRLQCVDALFSLLGSTSYRKDPEISLVTGEAIAMYADAFGPKDAVWTEPSGEQPESFDIEYSNELPPHSQVVYRLLKKEIKITNPIKRTACAPVILALIGRAARIVNTNPNLVERAFVKEIYCHLEDFQTSLLTLLADPKSKQLSRESCCLGLAACQGLNVAVNYTTSGYVHEMEEKRLNERLLRAFGQTSNHGKSALMESRAQNAQRMRENRGDEGQQSTNDDFNVEAEVGGAAGMGEAALGAYREMASASMILGRPDILYTLMILSVNHPTWSVPGFRDKYNASVLLGTNESTGNTEQIKIALRPHLSKLLPRMLRATHDPNPQTRDQMKALWIGLTGGGAESRTLISEHFLTTLDTLIDDAINKLWRARVGACRALSEIIVGRDWSELGGGDQVEEDDGTLNRGSQNASTRLLRLYKLTVRSLDDVRLTVRESGEALARSVRGLSIRLCTPFSSNAKSIVSIGLSRSISTYNEASSSTAAATILPWLVKYGLNQPCAEASGFSISCLLGVVEVSEPSTLQEVLPELIGALLMAMSGLEPAALNYLQVRAAGQDSNSTSGTLGYERLERIRLQAAQNGPIAGALMKCLEMMKHVNLDSQKAIIPQLDSALRCGAGFATRAAASDAVSSICTACPLAFKFPGSSTSNPTVRLLRALYFASERERGNAARDKMTHAFGNLAALAPGSSVRSLALRLCERYKRATGSNDDPAARRAAAAAMRAIAVRASNQFADGGSNDIWNRRVLPLAYIASHEIGQKDDKIGLLWKEVWDEGGQMTNSSTKSEHSFGVQLQEKLLPYITNSLLDALNDVSWQRRVMACTTLSELAEMNILSPPPQSLGKKQIVTEGSIMRAKRRAVASRKILETCTNLLVKSRVWDGKADLVKTIAKIAGKWISFQIGQKESTSNILGMEIEKSEICPWIPIVRQPHSWNDLFLNDRWFDIEPSEIDLSETEMNAVESDENVSQANKKKKEDTEKLNFDEEKNLFEDENEKDTENTKSDHDDGDKQADLQLLTFCGLCRALLDQCIPPSRKSYSTFYVSESLSFRAAVFKSLSQLLKSFEEEKVGNPCGTKEFLYEKISPALISIINGSGKLIAQDTNAEMPDNKPIPPLIVARSIECLSSAMWQGIQEKKDHQHSLANISALVKLFLYNCGPSQSAWTVREASGLAAASLSTNAHSSSLRKIETIESLLACTLLCQKDRKFWKVRYAGLNILLSLCNRLGVSAANVDASVGISNEGQERQLMLEALLPCKERILDIAKSSLSDNEAKVTSIASEICNAISWWP